MRVALLHPEWDRSCQVCEKWMFNDDGRRTVRKGTGLPVLRPKGSPTPCGKCEKVPKAARDSGADWKVLRKLAVEMSEANQRAWQFYRECKAVGQFPDDPLVRWYAVLCRSVEDVADRAPMQQLTAVISLLLTKRR